MLNLDLTKTYALAVSGGVDSMVMLHMFATSVPRPQFFVATVNHCLRKEAAQDCLFVENYCKQLGVDCKTYVVDVPTFCQTKKVSEETGARLLRLEVLNSLDADWVCTAHHADDNAETVLMHLIRGSGARGMEGIRRENGKFLRPLLHLSRQEIQAYATKHNVPFVEDATNSQTKYTRNFLRHNVIPLLQQLNGSTTQNITRFAERISEDNAYLESLADLSTVTFEDDSAQIPLELLAQPKPVAYRVLKKVFEKLGVWHDMEEKHFQALLALSDNVGGKAVNLPFGWVAVNDYDKLTVKCGQEEDLSFQIPFKVGETKTPAGTVIVSSEKQEKALRFDANKIPPTAVFRTPEAGDVFCKFGGGSKPLNRYLIDKKIPSRLRKNLILIADGKNVLVICGVEISDHVKTDANSQVLYISALPKEK